MTALNLICNIALSEPDIAFDEQLMLMLWHADNLPKDSRNSLPTFSKEVSVCHNISSHLFVQSDIKLCSATLRKGCMSVTSPRGLV